MVSFRSAVLAVLPVLVLGACGSGGGGGSRDFVRAVGSSTVYPFATAVAENFARSGHGKSPVIESTGTGAGMKLFCAGVGVAYPDIATASRRMEKSEYEDCVRHGVRDVVEIQIGIDGIAFAEGVNGPGMKLTLADIYKALAATPFGKPNTARTWADVNPALPAIPILVYGPPTTSGTRDALAELILTKGCESDPALKALKARDKDRARKICTEVRRDGAYVDTGENDNLIVQKLAENPRAIGVFGYSYLEGNAGKIKGVPLSGVAPTYQSIADFSYPGARPLYIYVKKAHLAAIRGLVAYVGEWTRAWGPDGYLKQRGLVIAPDAVRVQNAGIATRMTPLDPAELK